ncbi:unnamed protein product [Heligmosomoides polygyrus]|uniref:DUF1264 domain-containing protein n=1 Tax=Heligmosomoides polygyrus TaxID=6339 RepID=A0A183G1W4_HELPZ|nr:unnamed protein product [Heligmosomoides polygyrus]
MDQFSGNAYEVNLGTGQRKCHADQMKERVIMWENIDDYQRSQTKPGRAEPDRVPAAPKMELHAPDHDHEHDHDPDHVLV